ncbi:MAG: D-amino acid aminotransferase, partial [Rhodobacteraceae bacterium]|nr:D-amino acid aminotransferase [Paracoccaceae bacterium]
DLRWRRRDIKTVQLLYPSMAKMEATRAGADDAWLVEDGFITEGTSNNAYIVQASGNIVTRNLSNDILHGITRATLLQFAAEEGVTVEQRPFTLDETLEAEEAFITAASLFVAPVIEIDGKPVGNGKPGPIVGRLRKIYLDKSMEMAM